MLQELQKRQGLQEMSPQLIPQETMLKFRTVTEFWRIRASSLLVS